MSWKMPSQHPRGLVAAAAVAALAACSFDAPATSTPRNSLFIGIDVSGSFRASGNYDDALAFVARYLYGHLNGLGGLDVPRAVFVGSIGGAVPGEPQAFHPIHDFQGKSIAEIEADLRTWFPPNDRLTDFNAFFRRAADLIQRQNLTLAPITLVVLSDGVPDLAALPAASAAEAAGDDGGPYRQLELRSLEYLARSTTVRLLYPDPPTAVAWERHVPRSRVRLWTVDQVVMKGWRQQLRPDAPPEEQTEFWKWVRDNVDFRVRRNLL